MMRKHRNTTLVSRFWELLTVAILAMAPTLTMAANAVDPTTGNHTLGTTNNLSITLTVDEGTFSELTSDGTVPTLIENIHYTVAGGTDFTVLASYLNAQSTGDVNLVFSMTSGISPTCEVAVAAGNAVVDTETANHTLGSSSNLVVTLTPNGNAMTNLYDGTSNLVETSDYTKSGNTYTILASYLNSLTAGVGKTLTFQMDGGTNPVTAVTVNPGNATVAPASPSHTLGASSALDITLTTNGRSCSGIAGLTQDDEYTLSGNVYSIEADFLNTLDVGTTNLTFTMDGGTSPTATVSIVAGNATASASPSEHPYGSDVDVVVVTVVPNGRGFDGIKKGTTTLTPVTHYTVNGDDTYTIKAAYLNTQSLGNLELTMDMDGGTDPKVTIAVVSGDATVSPTNATHTLGTLINVPITLTGNGRSFEKLTGVGDATLRNPQDYTVLGNVYTIRTSYLNSQAVGDIDITFDMNGGTNPVTVISVEAGTPVVSPLEAEHTLGSADDLQIVLNRNGQTLADPAIVASGGPAITTNDYTVAGNVYTIDAAYLNRQTNSTITLTFDITDGAVTDPAVSVDIVDGNASVATVPSPASFSRGSTNDLIATLTLNGRTLAALKNDAVTLTEPTHYTIDDTDPLNPVYTILSSYIQAQGAGAFTLTFEMDDEVSTPPEVDVDVTASVDATLTSILSGADNNPAGGDGTSTGSAIAWDVSLANDKDELTLDDVDVADFATFELYDSADFTGGAITTNDTITLDVGANAITVKVTAEESSVVRYYEVNLYRAASPDASITSVLGVNIATLAGGTFASPATTNVDVDVTVEELPLAQIVIPSTATSRVYRADSFSSFDEITTTQSLSQGANHFFIKVIAQDTSVVKYYDINVNRDTGSTNATLTSVMGFDDATPSGESGADPAHAIDWEINVPFSSNTLVLADIAFDDGLASSALYDDADFTNSVPSISLTAGGTETAYIKLTAQDTSVTNHYAVAITRADGADADLLTVFGQTDGTPTGGAGTSGAPILWDGPISVLWAVDQLTATNVTYSSDATVTIYSSGDFSTPGNRDLAAGGDTDVYIKVTATNTSALHYVVTVTRGAADETATLTRVLGLTEGDAVTNGLGNADGSAIVDRLTWTFDANDIPFATTTVGRADIDVYSLADFNVYTNDDFNTGELTGLDTLSLDPGGTNRLYVEIIAEGNSATNYYEVIMSRDIGSTDAQITNILGVAATGGNYPGTSAPSPRLWDRFDVGYDQTTVGTNDIGVSAGATFELYSDAAFTAQVTTTPIDLDAGVETNIYIKVFAEDINTAPLFHKATILRSAGNTDAQLTNILDHVITYTNAPPLPDGATGLGTFANPYALSMTVSNAVNALGPDDLAVSELASDTKLYSEAFLEDSLVTGTNTIELTVTPATLVYVKVTAQDESVEKFYAITLTREPSIDAGLYSVLDKVEGDATVGGQAGTNATTAITWAITVPYTTLTVGTNNVIGAPSSTVDVYSDDTFTTAIGTNRLEIGMTPLPVYIKVTSEGGSTVLFYEVSISRDGGLEVSPTSLTFDGMTNYVPLAQTVTVENSSTNEITVAYVTTYCTNAISNAWFTLDAPTNFSLAASSSTNLSATVAINNLDAGTYTATNTFTDGTEIPWEVVVTLTINETLEDLITITNLSKTYTGEEHGVDVSTLSGNTNITVTYNGSTDLPIDAGSYAVTATVAAVDNWLGSTNTAELVVAKASQTITIQGTNAVYDGSAKPVTTLTTSGTDQVIVTYNGGQDLPIDAGTYIVSATTQEDTNYETGIATATLTISKGIKGIIAFSTPSSVQMGETVALSAQLAPAGLATGAVTFAVQSGPGSLDGTNLSFTGGGTVVVRASSPAEDNFNATSADQSIQVIDFAQADVTGDFLANHTGVHTLKFNDNGDLYLFYSSAEGGMNYAVQEAEPMPFSPIVDGMAFSESGNTNAFGASQLIGANSGATLIRSPVDVSFGNTTNIVGQSGTTALLTDMTNGTVASLANSAAVGLRNSRFVAGTAPTNHLFVNSGSSRIVAYSTTNDWVAYSSKDIGSGILSGAYADGDTIAVFTASGILISTNAGASYSTVATLAAASARGGEQAWYAANLKTVNQTYGIELSVNTEALSDPAWGSAWRLVETLEMGADVVSHIRLAAYENMAIVTWQQGSDNRLMYAVTQNHGATWNDPAELIGTPTYVRNSAAEPGYDIAVCENDEQVRFVLAAGLDYAGIDLSDLELQATALSTNVYLRWDAPTALGAPSDEIMIRVQSGTNAYPTLTCGSSIYTGSDQRFVHDSVVPDTTYFYGLWVKSGGGYVDPANFSGTKDIGIYEWLYTAPSAAITPATTNYDQAVAGNLSVMLTANGRSVTNITSDGVGSTLELDTHYSISGKSYTILESYLANQNPGDTVTLTFEMDGGEDPTVEIAILDDASVIPTDVNYDLGSGNLAITLDPNGWAFAALSNDGYELIEDDDYTVSNNTYTILEAYLDGLTLGDNAFVFEMTGGNNPTTIVTIANNATISPTTYRHALGSVTDLDITLTDRGRSVTNLTDSVDTLALTTEYTISSNVYSVLASYLDTLGTGDNTITFEMDGGEDPYTTVKVSVGNADAEIATPSYTLGTGGTRDITLTLNGRTLNSITDGNQVLVSGATNDYTVSGNTITLLADYLDSLESGTVELELNMDAGSDPTVDLFVLPGTATVSPATGGTYNKASNTGFPISLTLNGRSLTMITVDGVALEATTDYTVDNSTPRVPVYTIKDSYLDTLTNGTIVFTFHMSGGTPATPTSTITLAD